MSLQLLQYCVKNMSSEKQLILVSNPVNACSDCIGHFHNCLHAPSALYLHVTCIVKFMLCGVIIICWGEGVAIRMDAGHVFLANFKIHFWEARRLFFHVVEES